MKSPLVLTSVLLPAVYALTYAVGAAGFSPVNLLTFPGFVGCFTACAVLALAITDYARSPRRLRPDRRNTARHTPAAGATTPAWIHHTVSP